MSGFILFMMFFVSPPALPGKQVWSLHNTEHLEFESMDACKKYGLVLQDRLSKTATVKMRGWCINKATGTSTFDVQNPHKPLESEGGSDIYEIPSGTNGVGPKRGK
jgi:hypothetical protein